MGVVLGVDFQGIEEIPSGLERAFAEFGESIISLAKIKLGRSIEFLGFVSGELVFLPR